VRSLRKFQRDFVPQTSTLMAPVWHVLLRSLCNNEMVRNTTKHEFGVEWGGLGAFVAKIFNATSLQELVH
jgi:hypothetical protein